MNIYVFGNQDLEEDNTAIKAAHQLEKKFKEHTFIFVSPNADVPFAGEDHVIIMDTVEGLDSIRIIEDKDLDRLIPPPRTTVHDFDLGFQLKYLKKLGMLKKVTIIGLPMSGTIDYNTFQSIFKKLVAQDIHGS